MNVNKTYSIDENVSTMLDNYVKSSGMVKSKVVEFAIKQYIEEKVECEITKEN